MQTVLTPPPLPTIVERRRNPLAVLALLCALVGLLGLCMPWPTTFAIAGVSLGIAALFLRPRTLAVLAILLGMLGCGLSLTRWAAVNIFSVVKREAEQAALAATAFAHNANDAAQIASAVEAYRQARNGTLPEQLEDMRLPLATLTDFWGSPFRYELMDDRRSYRLLSNGPDQQAGTSDDIDLSNIISHENYTRPLLRSPNAPTTSDPAWPKAPTLPQTPRAPSPTPGPA